MKIIILFLISISCFGYQYFDKPKNLGNKRLAWGTMYYLYEYPLSFSLKYPLLDLSDKRLGPTLDTKDWCKVGVEGSVKIGDKTYNYAGKSNTVQVPECAKLYPSVPGTGSVRWKVSRGEFGEGVQNYKLIPYRTIAVDPKFLPYGTVIYLPKFRDKVYANTKIDGLFYSADTGGCIKNNHFDFFVGTDIHSNIVTSNPSDQFEFYIVNDKKIIEELTKIHKINSSLSNL